MIYKLVLRGLSDDFKASYQVMLTNLLETTPSDSSLCSAITRMKKGYLGVIDIFSSQGHFMAKAFGKDPARIACSLLEQINHQVVKWQRERSLLGA